MNIKLKFIAGGLRFFAFLPLPLARVIATAIGYLLWWLPNRSRSTTLTNIALCYPELSVKQRLALAKSSLMEMAKLITETGPVWLWSPNRCLSLIKHIRHEELMNRAQKRQQGILILLPHLGNWELLAAYLAQRHQVTALYQPPKIKGLESMIAQARERNGLKMVPTTARGIAQLLQALKAGETVVILPDQEPVAQSGGVFVPFMGVSASTMTLVSRLLQKTSAIAIFAYVLRENASVHLQCGEKSLNNNTYSVNFMEAAADLYAADPLLSAQALNRGLAACIAQAPAQYQWAYKRFKKQPSGIDFYKKPGK